MRKLDKLNAKLDRLIEVMNKKNSAPAPTLQAENATLGVSQVEFNDLINKIGDGLIRAGFIPQGLDQRYAATGAIETLGKSNTSVSGSVSTIYGLREVKRDIDQGTFNLIALPPFDHALVGMGPLNSWNAATANTIKTNYDKMYNILKKIQDLLPSLKF